MMRKIALVSALLLACAVPALAGPKDKSQNTLVDSSSFAGTTVNNATTATKVKAKGCSAQVQFKGLVGVTDNDIIICVASADVISPPALPAPGAGNGVVLLGEAKAGQVKFKADLTEIGCGAVTAIDFNSDMRCYLDDPAYRAGGWTTLCAVAGMVAIPNPSASAKTLKNSGEKIVLGLCQGIVLGQRLPAPSSTEIARQGARVGP